jgi:hypothetical protein
MHSSFFRYGLGVHAFPSSMARQTRTGIREWLARRGPPCSASMRMETKQFQRLRVELAKSIRFSQRNTFQERMELHCGTLRLTTSTFFAATQALVLLPLSAGRAKNVQSGNLAQSQGSALSTHFLQPILDSPRFRAQTVCTPFQIFVS